MSLIELKVTVPIPGEYDAESGAAEMTIEQARQLCDDLQAALPYRKKAKPAKAKTVAPK